MFGLIMAGLGLAYQIIFPLRSHSYVNAKIVMIFHFIAGKYTWVHLYAYAAKMVDLKVSSQKKKWVGSKADGLKKCKWTMASKWTIIWQIRRSFASKWAVKGDRLSPIVDGHLSHNDGPSTLTAMDRPLWPCPLGNRPTETATCVATIPLSAKIALKNFQKKIVFLGNKVCDKLIYKIEWQSKIIKNNWINTFFIF